MSASEPHTKPGPSLFGSLYGRLAVLLFSVISLLMVGFAIALFSLTRTHMDEVEQRLNRELAPHLLSEEPLLLSSGSGPSLQDSVTPETEAVDPEALHRILHTLMVVNPRIELYILDRQGQILAYEAPEGEVKAERVDLAPIQDFLAANEAEAAAPIRGTDPKQPDRQVTFSAAEIAGPNGAAAGYLYVVLQGKKYREAVGGLWASYAVRLAAVALAIALVTAIGVGLWLLRRVARRVEKLAEQSQYFADSGFRELPIAPSTTTGDRDEIDRLERTFFAMSEEMTRQLEELEQLDHHRRELVANVSHDLKTPVAILRGYIETLQLKSETLSETERQRILSVALAQSERLGRLVSDLFELAKLDAGIVGCQRDLASVAELVQDVAQKFELSARERQVHLVTQLDPSAPRAWIDLALMERVIENLLDNALRHTPEGGTVTVAVSNKSDRVEVCVEDTGPGISEEDMPRIFDRFYRGKANAADRRSNVGLGLAIAKKVLELHESTVAVRPRVDGASGTVFWFDLTPGAATGAT